MAKTREQILRENFEEIYECKPEKMFHDTEEIKERDLEVAIRLNNDHLSGIALIIQAEDSLKDLDEEHMSDEFIDEIRSTEAKLKFNKRVECARYGKPWNEIRDLFLAGQYEELRDAYSEDWDIENLPDKP